MTGLNLAEKRSEAGQKGREKLEKLLFFGGGDLYYIVIFVYYSF